MIRAALLLLLAGCSLGGGGDPLWTQVTDAIEEAFGATGAEAEPEGAGAVPEGAIALRIGERRTYGTLVQERGERRLWRSPGGFVVMTDGARVTATAGLREVLVATRYDGPDPLADPLSLLDRPGSSRRLIDLTRADRKPEGMRFGVALDCRLRAERTEDPSLVLVAESCRGGRLGTVANRFWVAADGGAVVRSEQWIGPGLPTLGVVMPQ